MNPVRFSESESPAAFRTAFCSLPDRVRRDPFRPGSMPASVCARFLPTPVPPDREFWLCYHRGSPVARISANIPAGVAGTGYFGLLELDLEADFEAIATTLLDAACDWLRQRGIRRVVGPIALNTWFPYRLRLDDGDPRLFAWEPVNPPDYVQVVEAAGFSPLTGYTSTAFGNLAAVIDQLQPDYQRALADKYRFREFGRDPIEPHLPTLYRLSHAAFADNFLFEPIAQALFTEAYVAAAASGEKRFLSWFVNDPQGEAVGFLHGFIDRAFIDEKCRGGDRETAIVLKSAGIVPAARGRGLSNALVYLALREGLALGADYAISALVRAGIQSESYARKGRFLWRHRYGLWHKILG